MTESIASAPRTAPAELRIGPWRVSPGRNELSRDGKSVRLEPKAIEVLVHLAVRPGEVVSREELLAAVWPGVIVGDDALTQAIIKLRKALGDDAHEPKYIETISKRGYRLIAAVEAGEAFRSVQVPTPRRPRLGSLAVAAVVLAAIAIVAATYVSKRPGMPWPIGSDTHGAAASLPVVAVLPLSNLSGDAKRDYFSDGMTEDIIAGLGRFSGLRVLSLSAVEAFKGKSPPPQLVRKELGAGYIVKGSVREADGRTRVAIELSDAEKGTLLGAERYDAEGTQLFEIQDRIVRNVVATLHVKLTQVEQQRAFTRPTESLEAHDLLLRARALLGRNDRTANREARALLARASTLAPDYPEILTALGEAELERALYGWVEDANEAMQRAQDLGQAALASPDTRSHVRAHALIASVHSNRGDYAQALHHAEQAIALNPSDSVALYRRGGALLYGGRIAEAIEALETARRIQPVTSGNAVNVASAYYVAGRYRDALAFEDVVLTQYPHDVMLHALHAATLAQLGEADRARQAADQVRRYSPYAEVKNFGTRFADPKYTAMVQDGMRKAGLQ